MFAEYISPMSTNVPSPTKKRRTEYTPSDVTPCAFSLTPRESLHLFSAIELCQLFDGHPDRLLFDTHAGDIQRNVDVQHLNDLKLYQRSFCDTHGYYSFSSQIVVAEHQGKYALVDGQHRLETLRYLLNTDFERASCVRVPVLVVQLVSVSEYDNVFTAINKNKPVMLYKNVQEWKSVGKQIEQHFMAHYLCYLKSTVTPQVPHLNLQALMTYLDEGNFIQKANMDAEEWIREIEALNACYRLHWRELLHTTRYVSQATQWVEKCEIKQPHRPLFLGMFRKFEWIDRIVLKIQTPNAMYLKMQHVPLNFRVKIKKPLRRAVWTKRNTESLSGVCYACNKSIHYDDFECGHIVSVFAGGGTNVDNLEPVCRMCNGDMGIDNLEEFKKGLASLTSNGL